MTLSSAILAVLGYTNQFEYPLTTQQIWQRLALTANFQTTHRITFKTLQSQLQLLLKQRRIGKQGPFYFLAGSSASVRVRQQRAAWSKAKWQEVEWCLQFFARIPWLTAVFVTGSLAMNNVTADDDIDFLLITSAGRLWLTRLLVTLIAWVLGKRRSWRGEEQNSWCFNLWLDETHLAVEPDRRRIYQAYEVIQAVPVAGVPAVIDQFYQQNHWVKKFLPNWSGKYQPVTITLVADVWKRSRAANWLRPIFDWAEGRAYHFQQWYMQPHRTTERVGKSFAFFHPRDTEKLILHGWQKRKEK